MKGEALRIAHRGYHARCLENTLEAFAAAYGTGCDAVEFDVQLSADGVPVVFHDDDLRRLALRREPVHALDAADLRDIPLRDPKTLAVGRIPTLVDFLLHFGHLPFYLEIKVPEAKARDARYWQSLTEKVCDLVSQLPPHPLTFVASFHLPSVRHALELGFARAAVIHDQARSWRAAREAGPEDPLSRRVYDSVPYRVFRSARPAAVDPSRLLIWDVGGRGFQAAKAAGVAGVVADDVPEMLRVFQNKA